MTTVGRQVAVEAHQAMHPDRWVAPGAAQPAHRTIVHVTAEYYPYARTGGLAEAVAGLAGSQADAGRIVVVFMPLYPAVRDAAPDLVPLAPPQPISVGAHTEEVQFFQRRRQDGGPRVVFIDAPALFARPGLYGERGADYPDNHLRFAIFSRAAVEGIRQLVTERALVHAHDWHAAFAPVFLRAVGTPRDDTPVVMSVHNAGFQGHFSEAVMTDLGLPWALWNLHHFEWYGQFNALKGGMSFCDAVATVSPAHAAELRTAEGGFGLHDAFTLLGPRLVGVCNGIDQRAWNPATDAGIACRFTTRRLEGKAACKDDLQRTVGLARRPEVPLFGVCARLTRQKGFDLMLTSERLRTLDAQFVFLGTGDAYYQQALMALQRARPEQVAVEFGFTDALEHRLMAGADIALVPSLYEPCGLAQMHAQRYGTIVIGRRTGGLHDTVRDGQTGFLFDEYSAPAFDGAIDRALAAFANADEWKRMMRCAMRVDFGWDSAAQRYLELYDAAEHHAPVPTR
ncbi:MAG: glycogen synthase [Gemmatimonadaceae bacterium]